MEGRISKPAGCRVGTRAASFGSDRLAGRSQRWTKSKSVRGNDRNVKSETGQGDCERRDGEHRRDRRAGRFACRRAGNTEVSRNVQRKGSGAHWRVPRADETSNTEYDEGQRRERRRHRGVGRAQKDRAVHVDAELLQWRAHLHAQHISCKCHDRTNTSAASPAS
eukprot:645968-Pleurochrysis_carterae.AAC.1